jgi:hypothetical protein
MFSAVNSPYAGQPDDHMGLAKSMLFASIDPSYQRTNPCEKY